MKRALGVIFGALLLGSCFGRSSLRLPRDEAVGGQGAGGASTSSSGTSASSSGTSTSASSSGTSQCDGQGACDPCVQCAIDGPCSAQLETCMNSNACAELMQCMDGCYDPGNPASWDACAQKCGAGNPLGAQQYYDLILCAICWQCPQDCAQDTGWLCYYDDGG
ncbi:MAG: hypothetical protein HY744_17540 [Deltaproteobacteria bacterium]|nr:hypothetical protein [Deltaproteobacteria bacterium]